MTDYIKKFHKITCYFNTPFVTFDQCNVNILKLIDLKIKIKAITVLCKLKILMFYTIMLKSQICYQYFKFEDNNCFMISVATGNECIPKSIMCYYEGNMMESSTELVDVEPKEIPCECEILIYSRFSIDIMSNVDVDFLYILRTYMYLYCI